MKEPSSWGFTPGERGALLLICAAVMAGIGYRWFQQAALPEIVPLTTEDSSAVAAIARASALGDSVPLWATEHHAGDSALVQVADAPGSGVIIDLNSANQEQLESLPGIGPVLARRILETRTQMRGFTRIDDLLEVTGIGPRRLQTLRSLVTCSPTPPK